MISSLSKKNFHNILTDTTIDNNIDWTALDFFNGNDFAIAKASSSLILNSFGEIKIFIFLNHN